MPEQDPLKYFGSEVRRLHYYNSQFLVAEDFNDEQLYHNQMRRLHNRSLHTWGVVSGLEVSGTTGATRVVVAPGIAIDRLGREVVLPAQPDPIGLDRFDADSKVYVTIGYADAPARKNAGEQATDDHYERSAERPKVGASAAPPAADAPEVLLAVLTLDRNKSVAAVDVSARRYAGSRFGSSDGKEFSLYADPAGAWHFFDGVKGGDRLTVDESATLRITDGDLQLNDGREIFFKDKGRIRSRDNAHSILFRRDENKLELREFGDIIFSPGATAGNEAVKVTMLANGNVGVGETTPATRLHVAGGGDTELSLQSGDNNRRWTLQATGGTEGAAPAGYLQIIDRTAAASRLTISTNGNVGIGTTDPGVSKLKISKSATDFAHFRFTGTDTGMGEFEIVGWQSGWNINNRTAGKHLYLNRDANATSDVLIGCASKELVVKGETGNVGIRPGTNSPAFPLTFPNELGDKISLWGQSGNHYGFGIQGSLLQIHSDTSGADIAFGYGASASFTETVRFKGSGNVGIGTADAPCRLTVRGGDTWTQIPGEYSTVSAGDLAIYSINVQGGSVGDWVVIPGQHKRQVTGVNRGPSGVIRATGPGWPSYGGPLYIARPADIFKAEDSNGNLRFLINGEGNVGVGTPSPVAKLHVHGSVYSTNGSGWTWGDREGGWGGGPANLSILASDSVGAANFRAFSDARIKEVAGRSDGSADLRTLLDIEVTDYRYRDAASKGGGAHKKVIGQQVERVFPQAVSRHTDVVPDIYRPAPMRDGWVELATDLKRGERVKLFTEAGAGGIHEVLEAAGDRFRVASGPDADKVFVFGREVDDFLAVDYDAIAMLNVSATQQMKREADEQVSALRSEVAELRAANEVLSHRLQRLESGARTGTAVAARMPNGDGSH